MDLDMNHIEAVYSNPEFGTDPSELVDPETGSIKYCASCER